MLTLAQIIKRMHIFPDVLPLSYYKLHYKLYLSYEILIDIIIYTYTK